ncbi:galactose oxidase [Coniophora puteana RWD-64-598 SS2]|uniref:Galactose oxidase n=1 Tax=Coniophora puteana (strain RWD-64-598) TaxID=741705 RepID=A0A5M3ME24_CONPW|nr:galactose oxidase [Coniophora puteana RWD-64-598 SS2]EIW76831.1 galactose oxidase [Coniophora puteana RWD-64-598 SS2]
MPGTPRSAARKPSSLRHASDRPDRTERERERGERGETASGKERERDRERDQSRRTPSDAISLRNRASSPNSRKEKERERTKRRTSASPRRRLEPRLPNDYKAVPVPATNMYWSRAPTHGLLPSRPTRAHTATLVDSTVWLFGGCDERGCCADVWTFDTDSFLFSRPDTQGDPPPPCRAHSATLVDRKIVFFGGGQGPVYYNATWILDTTTHRWIKPTFIIPEGKDPEDYTPAPRRAHTAVLYDNKIWVFGGGNGLQALADLWALDVSGSVDKLKWEKVETGGDEKPSPRGYHTANLVGDIMVVIGGSDGKECFSDVWCLNLRTMWWTRVDSLTKAPSYRRLSHTSTQVGSYLFVIGGHDGSSYSSDVLLYNLVSLQYEPRVIRGRPPTARGYHVALIADSRLFTFGGFNGHDVFDDVHILELAGAAYLPQVMSFAIPI